MQKTRKLSKITHSYKKNTVKLELKQELLITKQYTQGNINKEFVLSQTVYVVNSKIRNRSVMYLPVYFNKRQNST